ncbi:hypothetical protein ABVT39_001156 [Epinephelus coioides]
MLGTLCTLITALTYVDAAKVLTQTPAVHTVSTGQEAVLNCNIQRDENKYVYWLKQVPGEAPQFVLRFYNSHSSPDSYGSGFSSDRFNSKSSSNIDYQFIIKRTETGDSAVYYCLTWDDSAKENISQINNESVTVMLCINDLTPGYLMNVLCVSSGSSLPLPVLTVFPPSSAELQSNKASLVCLSSQSVPFADVSWLLGGSPVSSGISTSTAVQQADQTFQISSYLAVQTSDWNMDKVYTCVSGVTVLTQKPPVVTLRKGETATMDCNLGTVTNSEIYWYKQIPGGVTQYVLHFYHTWSSPGYGSGFSSPKFTSTHQSTSDYRLIINNVEEGDSAVYYCQTWDDSAKDVFISFSLSSPHTPTLLTSQLDSVSGVTVVTQKPPVVTLRKGETATMDCNLGTVPDRRLVWHKQIPGGVPQFVFVFVSPTYGSGFSSPKFTSTHQSTTDFRLNINNVEEGDSAVYYCQTWDNSATEHVSQ